MAQLVVTSDDPDSEEQLTSCDSQKAEVLVQYFSSVFTKEPGGDIPTIDDRPVDKVLGDLEFSEKCVYVKLSNLNISKSSGPDDLHPRVLKELASSIASPISIIFNTSVRSRTLPEDWKIGHITAIYKKGKRKLASNYRPVSLTSILCKVLESLIPESIIEHFKWNKLFSTKQFGFISGRSTTLQLLTVLESWTKTLDEGGTVDCIYMDFMKAFDTVPHQRLLEKIKRYGIGGSVLGWISAFLTNRQQRVCINGNYSGWGKVTSGIPQGSVLGPILFVIYINDLPDVIKNSFAYLFADDTKVYKNVACDEDNQALQCDLSALQEWSDTWLLKFHPDKCEVLSIGKDKRPAYPCHLETDGKHHPLKHVEQLKDLGIIMSTNLDFDKHISEKVNKANSMMGLIRRTFIFIDEENFMLLYKAFVRPHLEYGNAVWSPHKVEYITTQPLENVQRRATKLVPSIKDLPYEDRLKRLRLPTLAYRRLRGDMIETYKMFNSYDQDVALNLQRRDSYTRGHKYKLCMRRSNRDIGKYSFSNRIVQPWNSLNENTVCSQNLKTFEARLDSQWKTENLYYDYRASPPGACRKKEPTIEA